MRNSSELFHIIQRGDSDVPLLVMLCGLPGSGKSTYAKHILLSSNENYLKPSIQSSDALRKELYGDENTQGDHQSLFSELHKRIKRDLNNGTDVVYDATNIRKKNRIAFLNEISHIQCEKICVVMATPFEECVEHNAKRYRQVPFHVLRDMQMNWCPPHKSEGFDRVIYYYSDSILKTLHNNGGLVRNDDSSSLSVSWYMVQLFLEEAVLFDQENEHHTLTLAQHCAKTYEYVCSHDPDNSSLMLSALIHDNGKLYTKTRINKRGEEDGNCHYYQHHCVGAYNSLFFIIPSSQDIESDELMNISNYVYYHMHPYNAWRQSEKAKNRDRKLIGEKMYADIMLLHEADVQAH